MIGLDILTWGTDGESNPYRYPIYHYLWGGSIGHTALKLTLPKDPYHDALILKYCCSSAGKSVIPHYSQSGHWIVYFSWWPNILQEEYEDRIGANSFLAFEYEQKWRPHFTETIQPTAGLLRNKLGALYDWWFGSPKAIPKPIEVIIHPHPQAQALTMALHEKEQALLQNEEAYVSLIDRYVSLQIEVQLLIYERRNMNQYCDDALEIARYTEQFDKKDKDFTRQLKILENKMLPLEQESETLLDKLKTIKRQYHEVATVGMSPQQVHIGLGDEISPDKLLAKMREIAEGEFPFHKILYNCSTVVREVIVSGLTEPLKTSDCTLHLFDTPLKIHRFACELQKKLIDLRLEKVATLQRQMYLPQYQRHEIPHEECLSLQKSPFPRPS